MWFCFHKVLQDELDAVKERWNTHRIRKWGNNSSWPSDSLYLLPEYRRALDNRIVVPSSEISHVSQYIVQDDDRQRTNKNTLSTQ